MSTSSDDNDKLLGFIAETIEIIRDRMATKDDLTQLETRFEAQLKAQITAVRGDIEQVHIRLDNIERTLSVRLDQMEAEISRLRSVVYLLAKDRPEVLRLLGQ